MPKWRVHGKCQRGPGSGPNNCAEVFGGFGGAAGSIGGVVGGVLGGWIGSKIGEALCGSGKT
jgi:hypothetical protein